MARYNPATHDSFIRCPKDRCGVKNAPKGTYEYENECWRCGASLGGKPTVGDEVEVTIVDEDEDGRPIGKTDGGFVLFLEAETSAIDCLVEVTSVSQNFGRAEFIKRVEADSSSSEPEQKPSLGTRDDFWSEDE